ncbi:MAG: tRNA pseudouridine(38-40) synthase TruA [Corynebacterium sp.]|nr:tRNA pseudouridine(38-40) synthase TruA [Corynebacterium sp.]
MSELRRLRLDLAYDGSAFHGWARQGNSGLRTVQLVLEDALSLILRFPVQLTVAGRTDAGVHAHHQVAHFDIPQASLEQRSIEGDPTRLVRRLGKLLPNDLRVQAVTFAPEGFDARFSALRRHYEYRVTTFPAGALPTRVGDTATFNKPLDVELMQQAADIFLGLHDFAALCKHRPEATTIRTLLSFQWEAISTPSEPELFKAALSADAFCWSMVRSLMGASFLIGSGKRPLSFAADLLTQTERNTSVPVAPACGLALTGVDYPANEELAARALATRARRETTEVDDF